MNKQDIIDLLKSNYSSFVDYINTLSADEYSYSNQQKWTAGQQLEHLVLCVAPLVRVFSMDKLAIAQTFGQTDRNSRTYDELLNDYLQKFREGGKAPERFVPPANTFGQKAVFCSTLLQSIDELCTKIETFSEEELNTLQIPHPLLGNLTLREMLCNAAYHVKHHQSQAERHLAQLR